MKVFFCAMAFAFASLSAAAADLDINVSIGQPDFYGRLDIGNYPPPRVIYRRPVVIEEVAYNRPPIYLRVPPEQVRSWQRHCSFYDACGERVYFVQDEWYQREYVPRYRQIHGGRRDRAHPHERHHERRDSHDQRNR